ncbi:enoyl-CoA hydratase/isomerase family protein [Polaromonas sp. P1(28)-13]|nr:enoyl-CoA hydratase/isomerase family protein [Polaromonas sp. P1(28)-13]
MSDQLVQYEVEDGIGVITIDNPPVNALAPGVREAIMEAVARGNVDTSVGAMVLIGAGRNFIAGADIRQFGKARAVSTRTSAAALDASDKPVVAAMHGYALGGGLEHALACHYRVATHTAKVGLPEVTLGIISAGGGTQRLTRLIGPKAALDMLVTGRHVRAEEALRLGIVSELFDEDGFRAAAIRYARSVADVRPLPRVRDISEHITQAKADPAFFEADRKAITTKSRHLVAPFTRWPVWKLPSTCLSMKA